VVLAGRRPGEDDLARAAGAPHRALVEIQGRPMLEGVLAFLLGSPSIGRVRVSIDEPELAAALPGMRTLRQDAGDRLQIGVSEKSPARSALAALDELGWDRPVLVTTADHALLDRAILSHFLSAAAACEAPVAVGLVARSTIRARFPDSKRTYIPFRGEAYSGANLFALQGAAGREAVLFWQRAEALRKQPMKLARVFGWGSLALFALRRLDLEAAFARGSRIIGTRIAPVSIPYAEAAIDVDRLEDLALVRRILEARQAGGSDPSSTNSPLSGS